MSDGLEFLVKKLQEQARLQSEGKTDEVSPEAVAQLEAVLKKSAGAADNAPLKGSGAAATGGADS